MRHLQISKPPFANAATLSYESKDWQQLTTQGWGYVILRDLIAINAAENHGSAFIGY